MTVQIPAGYKQTDVGVIPEDWKVLRLKDISPSQSVGLVINPSTYVQDNGVVPMLVGSDIEENKINWEKSRRISLESNNSLPASRLEVDDLVVVRVGNPGIAAVVPKEIDGCNCASVMIIRKHERFESKWLSYLLNSSIGINQISNVQYGTAQKQFNISDAINFAYPFPPKKEQQAIAEALSDADALIESLEQLIAKKRQIKHGAMQELLTGQRRLPGFSGEWSRKMLPEIAWFQEGPGVRVWQFTKSGVKLLNGTNIIKGSLQLDTTVRFISEEEANGAYSHFLADEDDIVIASSGITIEKFHEKVAIVEKQHLPFCMNTSTIRFKVYNEFVSRGFLFHFLRGEDFKKSVGGQATGSAQLNFGPSHLNKVEILLPHINEQYEISKILSAIDEEVNGLENQLSKARQIKQGMMQELLTGRIRLIEKP